MNAANEQLIAIYADFETQAAPFRAQAACEKGCAYCCTDAGAIDATTQEGVVIKQTIKALQQLDRHGDSGHLTYILHMLSAPKFLESYLSGECKPEEIKDFGKSHQIFINRMAVGLSAFNQVKDPGNPSKLTL